MKLAKIFIRFTFLLAFAVCVSAQTNPYPNELKGYGFFRGGKLRVLRLGVSTKEDVERIFGENCDENCSYNSNWNINFNYLKADSCFTSQTGKASKQTFCPDKNFVGKLSSVELKPKKIISFAKTSFTNFGGYGAGGSISEDGQGRGTSIFYTSFSDGYGLTYSVFDDVDSIEKNPTNMKKDDLLSIKYEPSDKLNKKIFINQK